MNTSDTTQEIDTLCDLALLTLTNQRKEVLAQEISQMINYFQILAQFDADPHTEHTATDSAQHSTAKHPNCVREDEPKSSFNGPAMMANAPESRRNFFIVPNVLP